MEYVIVLLLIYLIFKDEIREEINYYKGKRKQETVKTQEEEKKEKRKEKKSLKKSLIALWTIQ